MGFFVYGEICPCSRQSFIFSISDFEGSFKSSSNSGSKFFWLAQILYFSIFERVISCFNSKSKFLTSSLAFWFSLFSLYNFALLSALFFKSLANSIRISSGFSLNSFQISFTTINVSFIICSTKGLRNSPCFNLLICW